MIIKKIIMGEKSIPIPDMGSAFLIGNSTGSVTLNKNWTIGLQGSGLTHDIKARTMIIHIKIFKTI